MFIFGIFSGYSSLWIEVHFFQCVFLNPARHSETLLSATKLNTYTANSIWHRKDLKMKNKPASLKHGLFNVSFWPLQIESHLPIKLQCNLISFSFSFISVSTICPLQKAWIDGWVVLDLTFFLSLICIRLTENVIVALCQCKNPSRPIFHVWC